MITLSQKRTCDRCTAFHLNRGFDSKCELGYKFDKYSFKPLEVCPKPKTNMEFVECNEHYKKI